MDSRIDTYKHKADVSAEMSKVICELVERSNQHDNSKLESPEVEIFDEFSPKLKELKYGSDEYNECRTHMKVALDHHYANNPHHPEFHKDGIKDMTLIDMIEMLCDWIAASKRTKGGNIIQSIEDGQKRFGYPDDLKEILKNTARHLVQN